MKIVPSFHPIYPSTLAPARLNFLYKVGRHLSTVSYQKQPPDNSAHRVVSNFKQAQHQRQHRYRHSRYVLSSSHPFFKRKEDLTNIQLKHLTHFPLPVTSPFPNTLLTLLTLLTVIYLTAHREAHLETYRALSHRPRRIFVPA